MKIDIKYSNISKNDDPTFAYKGDSGFDLRAWITKENNEKCFYNKDKNKNEILLKPLERALIYTGISVNMPENVEIQIRPRSGTALKKGLSVLNTPGTIDSNYTNMIGIIAVNLSNNDVIITDGERIAQAVVMPVYNENFVNLIKIDKVTENDNRNKKGFGSSGNN